MCKCKKKQNNSEGRRVSDADQKRYRDFFNIVDKYLIQYEIDDNKKEGYIVFIDEAYDIDWIDCRTDFFNAEELKQKQQLIAKLDAVHMEPCTNISTENKLVFKKKLAIGYELVMVKCFDEVDNVIDECRCFIASRNKEVSRNLFLTASAPIAILALIAMVINVDFVNWHPAWMCGFCSGILGAFVSIWTRYGKTSMTGLSSKLLHWEEALCRLLVGAVFAFIATLTVKCGLLLGSIDVSLIIYTNSIVGFVAGFSERFVPSLVEKIVEEKSEKEQN